MSKVDLVTQAEYARLRGVSSMSVSKAVKAGRISLINGKIDPSVADVQWAKNTRARVGSRPATDQTAQPGSSGERGSSNDGDYWVSRGRRESAEADLAELKLAETRGDLIRVAAVEKAYGTRFASLREALLQLPARLAPVLAHESDAGAVQNALITALHEVLQEQTTTPPPPDAEEPHDD